MLDGHPRRFARTRSFGFAVLGAACVSVAAATHPATATALLAAAGQALRCSSAGACFSATNGSSGAGIAGTSARGTGVIGTAQQPYSTGLAGINTTTEEGGIGVTGKSNAIGIGVFAQSPAGDGVFASASTGVGVFAESSSGMAVFAESSTATAIGVYSGTGSGVSVTSSGSGPNAAVVGHNTTGNGGDFFGQKSGLVGRAPATGGYPLVLTDDKARSVFSVDGAGDVIYHGTLQHVAQTAGGTMLAGYSATTTGPTVEDTGTAQLVGGSVAVRLDRAFAAAIDPAVAYRVFITPGGDTPHGLYVALKTAAGFIVREAQGGRSTVAFDYRVVGTAAGQAGLRMAPAAVSIGGGALVAIPPALPAVQPPLHR